MRLIKLFNSKLLFIVLLYSFSAQAQTSKTEESIWRQFAKNDDFEFYYDVDSIAKETVNGSLVVSGYTKAVPLSEESKKSYIMSRKEVNENIKGYEHFAYTLHKFEINITKKMARFTEIKDFDNNGKTLDVIKTGFGFSYFPSGSIFDFLYRKLIDK